MNQDDYEVESTMDAHTERLELFAPYLELMATHKERMLAGESLTEKKKKTVIKKFAPSADESSMIALIDSSVMSDCGSGILFTDYKVYLGNFPLRPKKVWYDEIESVSIVPGAPKVFGDDVQIKMKDGEIVSWGGDYFSKQEMLSFLNAVKDLDSRDQSTLKELIARVSDDQFHAAKAAGEAFGAKDVVNRLYEEEKFHARQGHGFAAEQANTLHDRMRGHDARVVGGDNAKDGPDRILDGVWIQSKYCENGTRCIDNCFEDGGKGEYRYIGSNHKPMVVEVPKDEEIYEDAVSRMKDKIANGQVPGVSDPNEATSLVKQGNYTYKQALNIAKAGNIDSLKFDATNGMVTAASAFGVSALITFATCVWGGDKVDCALQKAALSGLKVGGSAFVVSVVASQLSKAGLNSALVSSSEAVVDVLGPRASAVLINAFRSGGNIYGAAAMKSAAKLLRGNIITAGITVVALSAFDVTDIARGRISGMQLLKNIAGTTTTVAGGTGGWIGGAAVGSLIFPGVGTVVGGIIGSLLAGGATGKATDVVLGKFIKNDSEVMTEILEDVFRDMANEYLLNRNEAEKVLDDLGKVLDASALKKMYASKERVEYARNLFMPLVIVQVEKRCEIPKLQADAMTSSLVELLDGISISEDGTLDEEENEQGRDGQAAS